MIFIPLPGRVVLRVQEPKQKGLIHIPDQHYDLERQEQRSKGDNAQSSHLGVVLAVGEPARTKCDVPVPHGFGPGDEVVFIWTHSEKSFSSTWSDGEPCAYVPQSNILAIVERDAKRIA